MHKSDNAGNGNADGNKYNAIQHIELYTSVLKKAESSEESLQVFHGPVDQSGLQFVIIMRFRLKGRRKDVSDLILVFIGEHQGFYDLGIGTGKRAGRILEGRGRNGIAATPGASRGNHF